MHVVSVSLFSSAKDNQAVRVTVPWREFLEDLKRPIVSELDAEKENVPALKKSAPAFAPALFREDHRKKANVETAQVLTYDIDEPVDAAELGARLRRRGVAFAIHHTTSAGFDVAETGRGSVHVLIPLARPVDHESYLRYWDEARAWFHGIAVDASKRGPESLFFAPRIFEAHRACYFFDADVDAPMLGDSGFLPFRADAKGVDRYVGDVRGAGHKEKHVALNKSAFLMGLAGVGLEDTKTRLVEALHANVTSEPVSDWYAAERTIVSAWDDGAAQKDANDSRVRFVPEGAKRTGRKVLKEAVKEIGRGESLREWAYRVGQFVPHVIEYEGALDALKKAWEGARGGHDTRALGDAVRELVGGLDAGRLRPLGLLDEWKKGLKMNADGLSVTGSENNIHRCIKQHPALLGLVAYDVREGAQIYTREPPWLVGDGGGKGHSQALYPRWVQDSDKNLLAEWVCDELDVPNVSPRTALDALIDHASRSQHDGLLDYFNALGVDSGTDVLESILVRTLGAVDSAYTRAVTRKWLVGLVARQYEPGCQMDNMLVLVGDQGLGKSSFLRGLFPKALQKQCFDDTLSLSRFGRDEVVKLSKLALVELGELASMAKSDIESVKAIVSSQKGHERAAYARLAQRYERRAVFAGTTNAPDFLRDVTGNRRFWPVPVRAPLDRGVLDETRDRMWAQAVAAYRRGENWYLGAEEERLADDVRQEHEEADSWDDQIVALLSGQWPAPTKYEDPLHAMLAWQLDEHGRVHFVRIAQLADKMGLDLSDRRNERRLGARLRKLGWVTSIVKREGACVRGWSRGPVTVTPR